MTGTTHQEQRAAVMPTVAPAGPAMLDPMGGNGWSLGIADRRNGATLASHGFTAKRSPRHLGRSST